METLPPSASGSAGSTVCMFTAVWGTAAIRRAKGACSVPTWGEGGVTLGSGAFILGMASVQMAALILV